MCSAGWRNLLAVDSAASWVDIGWVSAIAWQIFYTLLVKNNIAELEGKRSVRTDAAACLPAVAAAKTTRSSFFVGAVFLCYRKTTLCQDRLGTNEHTNIRKR